MPLLRGVVFNKGIEKGLADEGDSLFDEVLGFDGIFAELLFSDVMFGNLVGDFELCFIRSVGGTEELVNSAEVDGEGVDDAIMRSVDMMNIVRKLSKAIDVVPDFRD